MERLKEALEGASVQPTVHLAVFDLDGTTSQEEVVSAITTGMESMAVDITSVIKSLEAKEM